jgi:hypothetical protein
MSFNDEKKCWEGNDENLDELMPDETAIPRELSDDFQSAIDELDEQSIIQMEIGNESFVVEKEHEQSFMEHSLGIELEQPESSVIIKDDLVEQGKSVFDNFSYVGEDSPEQNQFSVPPTIPSEKTLLKNSLNVSLIGIFNACTYSSTDTSAQFKGVERALQSLADIDLTKMQSFITDPSLLLPSKEPIQSRNARVTNACQRDYSETSRNSRVSSIQQILSSTSNKEGHQNLILIMLDISLNLSLDSLLSHLVKALKLTDEFQLVEVLDLSGYELTSVIGLSKYTPNLIELNL